MALLLTQTTRFGTQTYSRTQTPRYPATLGWTNAGIQQAPVQAPFAQYDWPVPQRDRPRGFDWVRSTPIQLIGSDTVYGAPGQVPRYDYPVPYGAKPLVKDWIWSSQFQLLGQDQLPSRQLDWPLPQRPRPGKDWIWGTPIQLIGQDTIYGAPGQVPPYDTKAPLRSPTIPAGWTNAGITATVTAAPFAQYDWPAPKTVQVRVRDWIWSSQFQLIGQDQLPFRQLDWPTPKLRPFAPRPYILGGLQAPVTGATPFAQYDWPAPKLRPFAPRPYILGGLQAPTAPTPFAQYDWPLPQTPLYPVHRNGWLDTLMVSFSPPPTNYDWPLPQRPAYPTALQTWIQAGSTVAGVINQPGAISFSPPQQPRQSARRGWEWPTPINLIGKDTVYGAPGQVPTYDTRPPQQRVYSTTLNGWLNPGITVVVAAQNPFFQTDWPVPQGARQPVRFGWIDFDVFQPQTFPFFQNDWPAPQVPRQPTQFGWIQTPQQTPPAAPPFFQTDWPQPPRGPVPGRGWIWPVQLTLIGQDTIYGAPGQVPSYDLSPPKRGVTPINLSGWVNPGIQIQTLVGPYNQTDWPQPPRGRVPGKDWIWPTPLVLIGQDKVYGAPGQVPTYDIQLAPRGKVLPPPGFISFPNPAIIPAGFQQSTQRPLLTLPIYPVFWKGRSS
jgi:hypothetical protein